MKINQISNFQVFHTYEESNCPYFKDFRVSRAEIFLYEENVLFDVYSLLLPEGFRRIKNFFYNNSCMSCNECKPLRVDIKNFIPNKSLKRILKKNTDIKIEVKKSEINFNNFFLYQKYIREIHKRRLKPSDLISEFDCIHSGYPFILEMNYYLEGRLVGVGVVDETADALSSVYFYYDPDERKRQLGFFSIMKEIELAKEMNKQYLYLGYYIENVTKMSYKNKFKPYEIFNGEKWEKYY
ncbi:MAG: arginyltransferase [Brevinematales bacterium]|nr:arginyltransferase [Brevinematales bacterium]